jgi:tetratricopeptide (TPR) repeat protein
MREFRALLTGATADLKAQRHDAALAKLKNAIALNERAYDAHVLLGSVWQAKGDLERAVGEFDAAAILNPVMAAPHVLAGDAYLGSAQLQRAMERADKAAALEPESGEVASLRGRIFERAGRGNEALAEYQRAIALNPSDTAARGRLVGVAMNLGRHDVAEPQLRTLLKLKYQPARTHFALGKLAEARGDRAGAATEYRRALALDPGLLQAKQALSALGGRQ